MDLLRIKSATVETVVIVAFPTVLKENGEFRKAGFKASEHKFFPVFLQRYLR